MARHGLGLNSAPAGLGLVRETNTAAAAAAVVPRPAAPVAGVERTQIGSPADLRQSAPAAAPAPKQGLMTPQGLRFDFENEPLKSIALLLGQAAAGFTGTETPIEKSQKAAMQRQAFKLRKDAQVFDAVKLGSKLIEGLEGSDATVVIDKLRPKFPEAAEILDGMVKAGAEKSKRILEAVSKDPQLQIAFSALAGLGGVDFAVKTLGDALAANVTEDLTREGKAETAGALEKARQAGTPPKTEKPTLRNGLGGAVIDVGTGEVVTPGSLNVIDQATGKPKTIPITSAEDLKNLTDRLASGELVEGSVRRTREVTDIPGAIRILLPGLPADMTPEQARLKGINIDLRPQTLEGLLESRGDAIQMDTTFTELQEIIAETPGAVGTAGLIARIGNSVIAQLPLIATLFGDTFDPELLVPENYEDQFRKIGVESQRGKSATLGAAYALALSQRRRGGRVAQQDIERALGQIGGTFGQDPGATIQILQDLKQRSADGFQTRASSLLGQRPAALTVTPSPVLAKGGLPELSTQAEVDKLPPGARFFWEPTQENLTKD